MAATEKRDLRTGAAVWQAYGAVEPDYQGRLDSQKIDVAVVGAGITGALVAEASTRMGQSTVIIDRRAPAMASTAASTALLQFEIDTPLTHLADQIGFDRASRAWTRSLQAVIGLAGLIGRLSIACAFRPRTAVYLSGNVLGPDELMREGHLRASIGLPSRVVGHQALLQSTGIAHDTALLSGGAADVNPVQLTYGLLRAATRRGAQLAAPVELAEVVPLRSCVGLVTADGNEIEAKSVIFATGYELVDGVPVEGHRRTSTWAFATSPQSQQLGALGDFVLWEASDPYLYIRSTIDGRLVVGGGDEDIDDDAKRDALLAGKVRQLQAQTGRLLPGLELDADYSWAGTFGESKTGLPTIGPVPDMAHCYAVLGYGGNGITFGYLAAELLAGYLTGKIDADAEMFAFGP